MERRPPARVVRVDDPRDDRLADYVGLSDATLRRAFEDPAPGARPSPHGRFIVEGLRALTALGASPYRARSVLVSAAQRDRVLAELRTWTRRRPDVYVVDGPVLDAVVGFPLHRGVVASAERRPLPDPHALLDDARSVAVLEALNDHENLGVLFRSAAAFGVGGVLLCPRCADPLYRRSVRVSLGHVLRVPHTRVRTWPADLARVRAAGFTVLALTPRADAIPIDQIDVGGQKPAVLLGAEGAGLSEGALAAADARVRIPMAGGVDALNVATAAAVAFHRLVEL